MNRANEHSMLSLGKIIRFKQDLKKNQEKLNVGLIFP